MSKDKRIASLLCNGKALFLAYDQGLEHGPADFNQQNCNPALIMDIATQAKYTGVIFHRGNAEHYYNKASGIPLIIKLNGKTNLYKGEPYAPVICTVEEAVHLGATAVGFSIYPGSEFEARSFAEFASIKRQADEYGLPTVVWAYPRGKSVKNPDSPELVAYAARVAAELGADFVKLREPTDLTKLSWAVAVAGKTRVLVAGGEKLPQKSFLANVTTIMSTGVTGLAVGRNIWQDAQPVGLAQKVRSMVLR